MVRASGLRAALDLIVQPRLTPPESLAADRIFLRTAREQGRTAGGVLRVSQLAGDVLALGRYHVAPSPSGAGIALWRRLGGGRAVPAGEGFLGVSLALPHRSALVSTDPLALTPAQVLNRCVRGILGACERAGVPALYPGRDTITVSRRVLGVVALEVDATGAALFEAIVGIGRDFSLLPRVLEAADPGGVVPAAMLTPEDTTSLGRELDAAPALEQLVSWLQEGYAARLDVTCTPREPTEEETAAIRESARRDFGESWLRSRAPRGNRRGTVSTQLGVLEAVFGLADGCLTDVALLGDFIAASATIDRLEQRLEGCAADAQAIGAVVDGVLGDPESFILGIGPPRTVVEAIMRGVGE